MCQQFNVPCIYHDNKLTLTSPIAIAADNKLCDIFLHYREKIRLDATCESSAGR